MRVVIVGAGIGGLAAAVAAAQAGHEALVFEQVDTLGEVGAGIGLAPNAVTALRRLGVYEALDPLAVKPSAWPRRHWETGEEFAAIPLTGVEARYGSPFWTVHRGDLHTALQQRASELGVAVRAGVRIESLDPGSGTVASSRGAEATGDLVVAADGFRSRMTSALFPDAPSPVFTENIAIRIQFDTAWLAERPKYREFAEDSRIQTWLGPGGHVVNMTIRGGKMMNFTFCLDAEPLEVGTNGPSSVEELLGHVNGWYGPLVDLVKEASSPYRWDLYDREPLPAWHVARAILIGDAAHAMMPYLGQGAAQAIEDAVVLGVLLEGAAPADVPALLTRVSELRAARAGRVQLASRGNRDLYHLPDGPEQRARDERIIRDSGDIENYGWLWADPFVAITKEA